MAHLALYIAVCICLLVILILWFSYQLYQNRRNASCAQEQSSTVPPPCDENLLKFDQEINQILNNAHLSDAEKEQLTHQCAEKYLNNMQSHSN